MSTKIELLNRTGRSVASREEISRIDLTSGNSLVASRSFQLAYNFLDFSEFLSRKEIHRRKLTLGKACNLPRIFF